MTLPRIAITVVTAMLIAGCGSSREAGPPEPTSTATPAQAPTPRPSPTSKAPFSVGGWIAYSGVDGIWALEPARPNRRIRLSRAGRDPIAWSRDGTKLLIRRSSPGISVLEADGTETRLTDADPT